jgi:hypothetical protein
MFVSGKPFQPSLVFVGKQGAYSGKERLKGMVGSGLTRKY